MPTRAAIAIAPVFQGPARALRKAALVMDVRARNLLGLTAIAFVTGCFDMGGGSASCSPGANGLAGKGTFDYQCKGGADPACDAVSLFTEAKMPPSVARGGTFGLTLSGGAADAVEPVSTKAVSGYGATFTARRAGHVGFVATSGSEAIDAVRLHVVEPERLAIGLTGSTPDLSPRLDLALAYSAAPSRVFRTVAMNGREMLAGTMKVSWSIDDPEVASIYVASDYTCTVTGLSPGTTRLHATFENFGAVMDVNVTGTKPYDPFDAGSDAEPDASDAGADQ